MIDTIGLNYPNISIDQEILNSWEHHRYQGNKGFVYWYGCTAKLPNGAKITYRYYPYSEDGLLKVEFSLPHVLFGTNVYMVCNIEQEINRANSSLPEIPGIPPLDLWDGWLYRLDIPYNYRVQHLVPYYIRMMQDLEYSRMSPMKYNTGMQFYNGQTSIKFYDKARECRKNKDKTGEQIASGILRYEVTLRKARLKRLTGKAQPTLHDITLDMLLGALEGELKGLNLLNNSIGTRDTTFETLCKTYGQYEGPYYFGIYMARPKYPKKETLAAAARMHPRTLDRRLKKIADAGIPKAISPTSEPLPALTINRDQIHYWSMGLPNDLPVAIDIMPDQNPMIQLDEDGFPNLRIEPDHFFDEPEETPAPPKNKSSKNNRRRQSAPSTSYNSQIA